MRRLLFFGLIAASNLAQAECFVPDLKSEAIQLRRTFDGAREETNPATIAYEHVAGGETRRMVHAGLKVSAIECQPQSASRWRIKTEISPFVEYHAETGDKPMNKLSGGISSELLLPYFGSEARPSEDRITIRILPKASFTDDRFADSGSVNYELLLSTHRLRPSLLGSILKHEARPDPSLAANPEDCKTEPGGEKCPLSTSVKLIYLPYVGIERLDRTEFKENGIVVAPDVDATFALARIRFEYWPVPAGESGGWQLSSTWTGRHRISGDAPEATMSHLQAGVSYFFDSKRRFAMGVDYERGRSHLRNFDRDERVVLSLKMKL